MTSTTVYVTGLPATATQDDVMDFFSRIGNVAAVNMPAGEAHPASVVAVTFDNADDAATALTVSGSDFQDNTPIHISAAAPSAPAATPAATAAAAPLAASAAAAAVPVTPAAPAAADAAAPADAAAHSERPAQRSSYRDIKNKVLVTNVGRDTTRTELRAELEKCGQIDDFFVSLGAGRAIVGFTTEEGYAKALQLNGTVLHGSTLAVKPRSLNDSERDRRERGGNNDGRRSEDARGPTAAQLRRVVVLNLPRNATKNALRDFFGPDCGTPADIFIRQEAGEAFLELPTQEGYQKALAKKGQVFDGNVIDVQRREPMICHGCGHSGHKRASCPQQQRVSRGGDRRGGDRGRRGGGGGDRRRRRSSSSDRGHRSSSRRHRSDSLDRDRRRRRRDSRSRSPPRRRRHSRSRSPPRRRH